MAKTRPVFTGWNDVSDSLIGGIAHALSNRVATLGALGELMRMDGDASEGSTMLRQEAGRFEAIIQSLRLLGNEAGVSAEALEMRDLLDQALALHKFHRDLRDVEITIDAEERIPPVRVERRPTIHALVMLLAVATAGAAEREQTVRVRLEGDESTVRLTLVASDGEKVSGASTALVNHAREQLERSQGSVAIDGSEIVLELPALGALRQKERAAR